VFQIYIASVLSISNVCLKCFIWIPAHVVWSNRPETGKVGGGGGGAADGGGAVPSVRHVRR
jgi:hypothetical protein